MNDLKKKDSLVYLCFFGGISQLQRVAGACPVTTDALDYAI